MTGTAVRIVAAGDIMLGDSSACVGYGFQSRHRGGADVALGMAADLLRRGDVVFGNLECLLCDRGRGATRHARDQMRAPPSFAADLRRAGFTALGVANNHAMQHGPRAFEETVEHLEGAGIQCVGLRGDEGWCAKPVLATVANDTSVGLLGYSWRPRQYGDDVPPYAEGDVDRVVADVERLRKLVDTVVVSLHWGEEFVSSPAEREVADAHAIIDSGALVLIGHHPHVTRPAERYGRGVVCYSLGNFVSDMLWQPALREGAMLECTVCDGAVGSATLRPTRVDDEYRVVPAGFDRPVESAHARGMPAAAYDEAVAATVATQRRALYRYAARHVLRIPLAVLSQLVAVTIRNKVVTAFSRLWPRTAAGTAREGARHS